LKVNSRSDYSRSRSKTLSASGPLLAEDELLGSLSNAALDGSRERQPAIALGLTILDATDANWILHIYSAVRKGFSRQAPNYFFSGS
jgi:hypothetical protein